MPQVVKLRVRQPSRTLSEVAYNRLEAAIVACELMPGRFLSILDLQGCTGVGRTPTHLAVTQLAADTLITIRPRHGLQIAPVDLDREQTLLELRRDLERFVVRLAVARATPAHRVMLVDLRNAIRAIAASDPIAVFNRLDRRFDQLLLDAGGEPLLERSLRPLHIISRRIGWIYNSALRPAEGIRRTLDCHVAVLDAVIVRQARDAVTATEGLTALSREMCRMLLRHAAPALLDCNLAGMGEARTRLA